MNKINVLDHGFVALRNISGPTRRKLCEFDADDTDPANAARMSFDQTDSGRTKKMDLKLADYLYRNRHSTPFEMVEIWLEMKLPIFVARQFVRHRTACINEVSGRYVTLPAEWYIPSVVGGKAANKKQGQEDNLDSITKEWFQTGLADLSNKRFEFYCEALDHGVAPEHARLALGLNHYTHWLWKQDLRNMLSFISLRDHEHAQIEAQMYAKAITELLESVLPETIKLYRKYK